MPHSHTVAFTPPTAERLDPPAHPAFPLALTWPTSRHVVGMLGREPPGITSGRTHHSAHQPPPSLVDGHSTLHAPTDPK